MLICWKSLRSYLQIDGLLDGDGGGGGGGAGQILEILDYPRQTQFPLLLINV